MTTVLLHFCTEEELRNSNFVYVTILEYLKIFYLSCINSEPFDCAFKPKNIVFSGITWLNSMINYCTSEVKVVNLKELFISYILLATGCITDSACIFCLLLLLLLLLPNRG
jgi:hypothetical protein